MNKGVFITGTDTGIGKTYYSCLLLQTLNRKGLSTAGMKPVASGAAWMEGELRNDDALALIKSASHDTPYKYCNPYCFEPPIAPHLAAEQVHRNIELDSIRDAFEYLAAAVDFIVVEGVGGWQVPLNKNESVADLAATLQLPIILVVGIRLGCINHALLTAASIEKSRGHLLGWVANVIDPNMHYRDQTIAAIEQRLSAPLLEVIEFTNQPVSNLTQISTNIRFL